VSGTEWLGAGKKLQVLVIIPVARQNLYQMTRVVLKSIGFGCPIRTGDKPGFDVNTTSSLSSFCEILRRFMIQIETTRDIEPALRELITVLKYHGRSDIAKRFEVLIDPSACWTTGSEFLTELNEQIESVVNSELLDQEIMNQLHLMSNVIRQSFEMAKKQGIRYHPEPNMKAPQPTTLRQWIRDQENESS
jgi:hypothetical protein